MRTDHIKHRNMLIQLGLFIVTLGISAVYWYYSTLKELHIANGKDGSAFKWTVLLLVPIGNLIAYWHYSSEAGAFTGGKYPGFALFIMWIIFAPIVWLLVQLELNKAARGPEIRRSVSADR